MADPQWTTLNPTWHYKLLLFVVLLLAFSAYSAYDGGIAYPARAERYARRPSDEAVC